MSAKKDFKTQGRRTHAITGDDPVLIAIADRIRNARTEAGLTQEELALVTGVDRKLILAVENARPGVAIASVSRIAAALGLHLRVEP